MHCGSRADIQGLFSTFLRLLSPRAISSRTEINPPIRSVLSTSTLTRSPHHLEDVCLSHPVAPLEVLFYRLLQDSRLIPWPWIPRRLRHVIRHGQIVFSSGISSTVYSFPPVRSWVRSSSSVRNRINKAAAEPSIFSLVEVSSSQISSQPSVPCSWLKPNVTQSASSPPKSTLQSSPEELCTKSSVGEEMNKVNLPSLLSCG